MLRKQPLLTHGPARSRATAVTALSPQSNGRLVSITAPTSGENTRVPPRLPPQTRTVTWPASLDLHQAPNTAVLRYGFSIPSFGAIQALTRCGSDYLYRPVRARYPRSHCFDRGLGCQFFHRLHYAAHQFGKTEVPRWWLCSRNDCGLQRFGYGLRVYWLGR